jgi:hypothetical protein
MLKYARMFEVDKCASATGLVPRIVVKNIHFLSALSVFVVVAAIS